MKVTRLILVTRELGSDYSIGWTGSAYQELSMAGTGYQGFLFGLVMVFLILAAQYERCSASRHSVGTGVVGGMIAAPGLAILFVPLFFRLLTREPAQAEKAPMRGEERTNNG